VTFRYQINLIRKQVEVDRQDRSLAWLLAACLLILAVMLVVTYGVYVSRDQDIADTVSKTELLLESTEAEKVGADQVERLRERSKRLRAEIDALTNVLEDSASWSYVLVELAECAKSDDIRLKKVKAEAAAGGTFVLLEGACTADNPVLGIRAFIQRVANRKVFGHGRLLSIRKEEDDAIVFEVQVPLRTRTLPQTDTEG